MSDLNKLISLFKELSFLSEDLNIDEESDNMISTVTIEDMTKLLFKAKEKAVLEKHNGPINPITITKRGKKIQVYKTSVNRKRYQANTYVDIIDKLAIAYGIINDEDSLSNFTLKNIFKLALNERKMSDGISNETYRKYECDFKRYISENFANQDIRKVIKIDIKIYSQSLIHDQQLTVKSFKAYKSVLNLIFNYATDSDHEIIGVNPVTTGHHTVIPFPTKEKSQDSAEIKAYS